jgi:hypothetical protein
LVRKSSSRASCLGCPRAHFVNSIAYGSDDIVAGFFARLGGEKNPQNCANTEADTQGRDKMIPLGVISRHHFLHSCTPTSVRCARHAAGSKERGLKGAEEDPL